MPSDVAPSSPERARTAPAPASTADRNTISKTAPGPRELAHQPTDGSHIPDGLPGLLQIMERLLGPRGCAWDREQTLDTLRPYLIEEAYEVLESMDDPDKHRVELGDLLFQIVFQSALRERDAQFQFADVVTAIRNKMLRRHPHVFAGGEDPQSAQEVARRWEAIKAQERAREVKETIDTSSQGSAGPSRAGRPENPLAGIPVALPALQRAWRMQNKAAAVGFDWPDHHGAMAKVEEEWQETKEAIESGDRGAMTEELGDLLFVLVRLAQKLQIDPEQALRTTIHKFETRFSHVMQRCHEDGVAARDAGLERLDQYWNEAKVGRNPEN